MRFQILTVVLLVGFGITCIQTARAKPAYPKPDTPAVEKRVDRLLTRLTRTQKLNLIGGITVHGVFYTRAEPSIGLPRLRMSDGPYGVRSLGLSTAYAAGVGLAAAWDPQLAREVGGAIGRDAKARGVSFLLGPGVNIYRYPLDGRNFEFYGEDPLLAGKTAVGFIDGVQAQGVVATVKHFVANNSEYDRRHLNTLIDPRALHEIYLPAFRMAVQDAHVGAVMGSYNLVNGKYMVENPKLADDLLKKKWGFKGIFMSDWGATHDGVDAFKAGLDLEMPSADFMSPKILLPGLEDGKLSMAVLNDKVRRLLRTAVRFDLLDKSQQDLSIPLYNLRNDAVALKSAREALVLLKNRHHVLPLDAAKIKTIAVIGPDAHPAQASAGGSAHVTTFEATSILEGITEYLGRKVHVLYSRGLPTPDEVFKETAFVNPGSDPGLKQETFDNPDFEGKPSKTTYIAHLDQWKPELWTTPATKRESMRWTGHFIPEESGRYLFLTAAASADTYVLYINGKPLITQPKREGQAPRSATLHLTAGTPVSIRLDYKPDVSYSRMGLGVIATDKMISPDARKMAKMADAAVVAVGFSPLSESEAFDRNFHLPWGQEALINAVATANKKTIVSVTSGGAYATDAWLDKVPALLQNWYPGQEGGKAVAEVLFGARSPEGKLPFSFDRKLKDDPVYGHYHAPAHARGTYPKVTYAEGVFVGYRWYTSHPGKPQPLFAFGYGLSYTHFKFANLTLSPSQTTPQNTVTVAFDVSNTGHRAGAEVAQVYVGDPSATVKRPEKELKAFRKMRLKPGETRHVSLTLDRHAFSYYDANTHAWRIDPGRFKVYLGDASNHTPLSATLTMKRR